MQERAKQSATRCPACQATGGRVFYETAPVPVHSCLMLADEQVARAFPRRPIALGFCPACGFVSNTRFDPSVQDYDGRYEDQQSFSRRFREFQTGVVNHLVDWYRVRGKNVVEIGCGKGDFLRELCQVGKNRGVGIDPRSNPADDDAAAGLRFVPECYSRSHWDIPCELVACRHTLEHLYETDQFLSELREGLEPHRDALVFFEVPDAMRVFREQAFWDIYYEHCSYFTPGSLARLFRRNRFEILELSRLFEGQYLIIVARPGEGRQTGSLDEEEKPYEVASELEVFSREVSRKIADWKSRLTRLAEGGRRVAVWGAGSKCVSFLSTLECEHAVETIIDINPHQQNKFLPGSGKRIMSPDALGVRNPDVVLVMNPVYRDEIGRQLDAMQVRAELMCV